MINVDMVLVGGGCYLAGIITALAGYAIAVNWRVRP